MKINKIKINSYGKLKEKEINLNNGINILYGKNEAGKSTLLKFIINSFYGISKNKKGKEYSDYEKYLPWTGEEFSGKLEYELNNKNRYEIYRDFKKKNPKIFNENMEDISKEFNIDKNKGNEFFYEQTKVDEDLFLSTIVSCQDEVKLEKTQQSMLIQKIANLVGTGEDNVSYKRAIDRINRRQLDEVGTERSREKPINVVAKKIEELQKEKEELEKYGDIKYQIADTNNKLEEEILYLEQENNFNAFILSNIADNFNLPNRILDNITKEFFKLSNANYDNFKHNFKEYFGSYAGAISPYIYALCLSNTNARRSRAGKTFENVIYHLYSHFNFSFDAQANIGKNAFSSLGLGKVVDSILPSIEAFEKRRNKCIVGSMKTSLRERWQEVVEEISRSNLPNIFLLTCDDDISANKIKQMREHNIILVVFDEVKNKLKDYESVISFENYFCDEIPAIMDFWNAKNN